MLSQSISLAQSPSERQFVDDLTSLCKRHKISCGTPKDIAHLGADLASNESFRADLLSRCTAETNISPEQMLILVACAFGGSETSIFDVTVDLPQDAMSAFLDGCEISPTPELDPQISSPRHVDRDQEPISARPGPTLLYSAASRPAPDPRGKQDDPPASRVSNGAPSRRHIPPNTPLESLTLSELRMYLEDIENRVSRLEPRLERIAPQRLSSTQHIEQPEAVEVPPIPELTSTLAALDPEPAVVAESVVPAAMSEPVLDTHTPSPPIAPQPHAIAADILSSATDASRLRRLRIVNAVLAFLLILVCGFAAIFGYRYLHRQPATAADAASRSPLPLVEQPSKPAPAPQANKTLQHSAAPSATSSIPTSTHQSGNTTSSTAVSTHPPQALPVQPTPAPATVVPPPAPRADTKSPEPSPTQAAEAPAPSHTSLQPPVLPTPDNQDHSQARPSPSDPQPDRSSVEPEHPSPPSTTRPLVSSAAPAPAPAKPASASVPDTIPHPARPTNAPVVVPGPMMMSYAIFTPKPVYPSFRHLGVDSAVDVEVNISKDGRVTSARALDGGLDVRGAAVRAVQDWRFSPYILSGNPVAVVTTFKFVFRAH